VLRTHVIGNDLLGNRASLNDSGTETYCSDNRGYNPAGPLDPPPVPPSGEPFTHSFNTDCDAYITASASTVQVLLGTQNVFTVLVNQVGLVHIPFNTAVTLVYSNPPAWTWFGE
jgi:hypothetical protein